ncbi:hypothetical protein [Rhodococcoides yunnanense]|uniref:hypothetical protein n=1 Tax=Rhodococcoides yunnanense TaxID=278209 RepID=UPI0022B1BE1E|nr:hypothetical protein [Rhodococcus yunnanensis]MCZ4277776.1 hypothetical protein [Rhodococcus yunnanensis]
MSSARRSRNRVTPDGGAFDPDRGSSEDLEKKQGVVLPHASFADRAANREHARGLDTDIEGLPGLTRARRDLERAFPRNTTAVITNERKRRTLPAAIELRRSLSARQRNARSATKRAVEQSVPRAQHRAMSSLIGDPDNWKRTNDALSDVNGDAVRLDDDQRRHIQRVDRAIQRYERESGRGHLVYTVVSLPHAVIHPSELPETLSPGSVVAFDRFTGARHSIHELDAHSHPTDAVFEIQTTRGLYLGASDKGDDTSHLLPRGTRYRVVNSHFVPYERPGRSVGERLVVQLEDIDTD